MTQTGQTTDIRDVQVIKEDRTFLLTDRFGDVPVHNEAALGLYHRDTRFLSALELTVNGQKPLLLHSSTDRNYSQVVELACPAGRRTRRAVTGGRTSRSSGRVSWVALCTNASESGTTASGPGPWSCGWSSPQTSWTSSTCGGCSSTNEAR